MRDIIGWVWRIALVIIVGGFLAAVVVAELDCARDPYCETENY